MVKVLIVDDSIFSQKINANFINKYLNDVEFFYADDGLEGFEKYKEINPDYIILDLLMPKLNGKELIELIKQYDNNAKIIVVTADVQKSVREEIDSYNIMSFVNKPLNDIKAQLICEMIRSGQNGW